MSPEPRKLDLTKLERYGKLAVVELDDEVEYILDHRAFDALREGMNRLTVIRVVDRENVTVTARRVLWALQREGVIDYLHDPASGAASRG